MDEEPVKDVLTSAVEHLDKYQYEPPVVWQRSATKFYVWEHGELVAIAYVGRNTRHMLWMKLKWWYKRNFKRR